MSVASNVMTYAGSSALHSRSPRHARPKSGLLSLFQLLLAGAFQLTVAYARPTLNFASASGDDDAPPSPSDPGLWIYLGTAIALVLIGGAFAGLTIALMGQDEVYLQVISTSGERHEKKNARKVLNLLHKGKHWVLVTLLVGNVITNETLPLVLDRSIGGGYAAAISSTVLVIVFGEIVPQSICVRFGLPIGAWMSPIVLLLMWIFAPISWPIAKLLDHLLGEDHGTTYKKAGLKTLVTLHKTLGTAPGERLNEDEVSIISGVLDLKAKPVGSIMTPMNDVFTLSADAVLDETMIDTIMHEGYSRIPVYEPSNGSDFVGMLLVKMLITYDPEDCLKVSDFILATLPETLPDTSCLDIINFFQQGKSHMVLVSDYPGEPAGALGVVTLEDVIEELIGEEIIDESDVYIDVHKAIRRMQPAPTHRHCGRIHKGEVVLDGSQATTEENLLDVDSQMKRQGNLESRPSSPEQKRLSTTSMDMPRNSFQKAQTFIMRRTNSTGEAADITTVQMRPYTSEIKEQLRNIGPSNVASRPKQSRINTVKVKPGVGTIPEHKPAPINKATRGEIIQSPPPAEHQGSFGQEYVSPGHAAKDAVQAMQAGYGTCDRSNSGHRDLQASQSGTKNRGVQAERGLGATRSNSGKPGAERRASHSTLGSMYTSDEDPQQRSKSRGKQKKTATARSGSITENLVDTGGVQKLVLEMTSSSEDAEDARAASQAQKSSQPTSRAASQRRPVENDGAVDGHEDGEKKKKKRRRPKKKKPGEKEDGTRDENVPLMARR